MEILLVTNPKTGQRLEIASKDFEEQMTWTNAERACSKLSDGWVVPTIDEF
jgi:glutamate 5-kinase